LCLLLLRLGLRRPLTLRLLRLALLLLLAWLSRLLRSALLSARLLPALLLPAPLRLGWAFVLAACLAGALLELADLFLHEAPRLRVLFRAQLIVPAVRATLPSFRIGLPAGGTENAFWERHR
jgi:hypothetical protein